MALKRQTADKIEDVKVDSLGFNMSEPKETDISVNGTPIDTSEAEGKPSWDLDAFAPYKPADPVTPAISATTDDDGSISSPAKKTPITLDDSDFGGFSDPGFATGLQGLHASPAPNSDALDDFVVGRAPVEDVASPQPLSPFSASSLSEWSDLPEPEHTYNSGSASSNEPARLFIRIGKFSATYDVDRPEMVIGRLDASGAITAEVTIEWDDAISRRHARIVHQQDTDYIEDLGSTNGTKLNGIAIPPHVPQILTNGDLIHIGVQTEIAYYK